MFALLEAGQRKVSRNVCLFDRTLEVPGSLCCWFLANVAGIIRASLFPG